MPLITGGIADPITITGLPGSVGSTITGEIAEPVVITGLPGLVGTPDDVVVPTTSPDAVRARVLDKNGTFICNLPHAQGLRWLDEFNSAGNGSLEPLRFDDLEDEHSTVWAAGNQVVISVGSLDIFRIIFDAEGGYRLDEVGQRVDTRAGLGQLGIINSGMVEPEYGWRHEATEERSFDYGSNPSIGGWLVAKEWKTPVGKLVRQSWRWTYRKRHLPKHWPDRKAQWLWWKNPDSKSVADETCYFRSSFTLSVPRRVKFWVCGDDTLEFQVDGEVRAIVGPGGWKKPTKIVLQLSAGTHTVAAKVQNSAATDGNSNRSGFLCTIARISSDGDILAYIRRTTPSTWTVRRQLSGPPGWFPAQIAKRLVDEQISRGCAGHSGITYGFTTTKDSAGVAWTGRRDMALTVETLGLDWLQKIVEAGVDVAMTPGLKLNMWRKRGVDRSRTVRLQVVDESSPQSPQIRNVVYAKARSGWVGRSNAASIAANGRRESGVSLGSSRSRTSTANALASMLPDLADPPQTIEVRVSGATGPQPYKHFNVGDWVSHRRSGATTWGRYRVMSIGGEVNPAGHPDWTIKLYED
jgi:hypothetical protein